MTYVDFGLLRVLYFLNGTHTNCCVYELSGSGENYMFVRVLPIYRQEFKA
jgi:hypothetical protein